MEASLGFFVCPLFSVLFGTLVLGERLRSGQLAALALAGIGLVLIRVPPGRCRGLPCAGGAFAAYALVRKQAGADSVGAEPGDAGLAAGRPRLPGTRPAIGGALGLSVDDTFHCLIQFHRERKELGFSQSLFDSYRVSGPGVILSSLAVAVGFMALRASEFEPFVNFGTMVAIATAGSTLGNLVLLPSCLTLGHRWSVRGKPVAASVSTQG